MIDCDSKQILRYLKKLKSGETVLIDGGTKEELGFLRSIRHGSLTLVPVMANDNFWGFFAYHFKHSHPWFATVLDSLSTLSDIMGAALERKGQEKEIRFLQEILNSLTDSLIITNAQGIVLFSNKTFCKMLNLDYREIIGQNLWKDNSSLPKDFWDTVNSGETWEGEVVISLAKKKKTVHTVIIPILDGNPKQPSYFLAIKKECAY